LKLTREDGSRGPMGSVNGDRAGISVFMFISGRPINNMRGRWRYVRAVNSVNDPIIIPALANDLPAASRSERVK